MGKIDKFDTEDWQHYGIEQRFRKLINWIDRLVEGNNELKQRLENHISKGEEDD